jgi:pimeloyl-ACP methyl ester carboxylesterase
MFHPLPDHVQREYVPTPGGPIELIVSQTKSTSLKRAPVLFVHGGFGHASVWLEWMTYLSTRYDARLYAVSVRNHGASHSCRSWWQMVYQTTLDDICSDIVAAINEIERREGVAPILVTHSAGGATVQYILANGMVTTPALALTGAVPHYGFLAPLWNWLSRLDWFMFVRGTLMLQHPRSSLCTTTLVQNAFFGPDYPREKVKEFEKWMAPYEAMRWPSGLMGSWKSGRNVFLDPQDILRHVVPNKPPSDRILIMMGTEDKLMQGTQERSVAEYAEAMKKLRGGESPGLKELEAHHGVRLVEIKGAGHHLQNDVQWEDGANALLLWLNQL